MVTIGYGVIKLISMAFLFLKKSEFYVALSQKIKLQKTLFYKNQIILNLFTINLHLKKPLKNDSFMIPYAKGLIYTRGLLWKIMMWEYTKGNTIKR